MMSEAFVNCDWGTTRLRLRAVRRRPWEVTTEFRCLDGIASVAQLHGEARGPAFAALLAEGLKPLVAEQPRLLAGAPILISGMLSSSIGWRELPYAELPLALDGSGLLWEPMDPIASEVGPHPTVLISGARTATDVMRGEETEVVGLFTLPLSARFAERALVIKPGTHSKHIRIAGGQMTGFTSFMTGELFDVLSTHSILRHSTATGSTDREAANTGELDEAFSQGVREAAKSPLGAALFRTRTRQVLDGAGPAANRAFLSGVLVGAELVHLRQLDQDVPLVLCATEPLASSYRQALETLELLERLTVVPAAEVEMLSARGQAVVAQHAL